MHRMLCLLVIFLATFAEAKEPRPNILFIFADDLGYGDLACYGHPYARTPNLDRLASEGTRFLQAYVTGMTCCPSRTGVMTGRFPARYARYMSAFGFGDRTTVTELLKDAGYRTGHVGKWHIGPNPKPGDYGLEWIPRQHSDRGGSDQKEGEGRDTHVFDEAISFLEKSDGRPFYLNVWGHISHFPVDPDQRFAERFADVTVDESNFATAMHSKFEQCRELNGDVNQSMRKYLGEVSSLDDDIGRLLRKIDELGVRENTIVVFSSDHGPAPVILGGRSGKPRDSRQPDRIEYARNMLGSPEPFRGGKHTFLEGGVRTPFIIRWPGHVPARRVNETSVISFIDWLPTVCRLAGVPSVPDDLDGEDVSDIWLGNTRTRTRPLFWRLNKNNAATVARLGKWKYFDTSRKGASAELYDLSSDLDETTNLATSRPEVVHRIKSLIGQWEAELPKKYFRNKRDLEE